MLRAMGWIAAAFAAIVAVVVLLHLFISPINPAQEPPSGHFPGPCVACHFVSDSAQVKTP